MLISVYTYIDNNNSEQIQVYFSMIVMKSTCLVVKSLY